MLLKVEGLCTGYGAGEVLHGVHLHVVEGEIVSILGANGAGKTTLLRAISRLLPLHQGSIRFGDAAVRRWSAESLAKAGLGHVPEGRGVLASLTVRENLRLGLVARPRSSDGHRSDWDGLLDRFPVLGQHLDASAASLSGGQQQMLALARALLARPKLLMVDELSFGLAPAVVDTLFTTIRDFRETGTAFLLVEQTSKVLDVSDRSYVLRSGETVLEAPSGELIGSEMLVRSYMGEA